LRALGRHTPRRIVMHQTGTLLNYLIDFGPMKKNKALYWISTALMAALILMASIPDVLQLDVAVKVFVHLGYPIYLLRFIGVAKILGVIAIVVPGFPRLREWAYAGLVFDLSGAFYSHISVGDQWGNWILPLIGLILTLGSYWSLRIKSQSSEI
jgi:uncharacterized membrane protein YphA (DoxX/SURF4 family)